MSLWALCPFFLKEHKMDKKLQSRIKHFIVDATWQNRIALYKSIDGFIVNNDPRYNLKTLSTIPLIKQRIEEIFKNFKVRLIEVNEYVSKDDFLINNFKFSFDVLDRKSRLRYKVLVGDFLDRNGLNADNQTTLF